jgi:hypothetical protein
MRVKFSDNGCLCPKKYQNLILISIFGAVNGEEEYFVVYFEKPEKLRSTSCQS